MNNGQKVIYVALIRFMGSIQVWSSRDSHTTQFDMPFQTIGRYSREELIFVVEANSWVPSETQLKVALEDQYDQWHKESGL